jgi:hypothetical protein
MIKSARLYERAWRERWPIAPEMREQVIATLAAVLASPTSSPREKAAASRALIQASKCTLDGIRTAALAKRIGDTTDRFAGADEDSQALRDIVARIHLATDESDDDGPFRRW